MTTTLTCTNFDNTDNADPVDFSGIEALAVAAFHQIPSGFLSATEKGEIEAEFAIRFANESRQDQQLVDALFNEDTAAQGRIVFTRHALESVKTTNDRVLTKRVLHIMEPLSCHPGVSADLLDTVHTMLIDMYYYGRERLLTQAYDMGAAVKV
ncbi:hypothetical protein HFN60_30275 [Rhizobium leguminosarum]|uniref:hypothetical protein n=1 Tax=Rhizobium leguminosarum TaxID=384 RepID=UPI001C967E18|nr:hypothetical protein [Rhizobium leguminosarum]MBY5819881.1 hypothetical protein [Rhizobium leguminosarum]